MSDYNTKEPQRIDLLHSKAFAIAVIAFITIMFLVFMIGYGINNTETTPIDIARTLPSSGKIVLTQDLAKEHMVAYLNNQKAFKPFLYGAVGIVVILFVSMIFFDVRKIMIERREESDEEERGIGSFMNLRTYFMIAKAIMIIVIVASLYSFITRIENNTKSPESQTPSIQTVTVIHKDTEIKHDNDSKTTYYSLTFDNGAKRRVSESDFEYVKIDHTYYMGLTEQDHIFGFYDTDIYELPQGELK